MECFRQHIPDFELSQLLVDTHNSSKMQIQIMLLLNPLNAFKVRFWNESHLKEIEDWILNNKIDRSKLFFYDHHLTCLWLSFYFTI